MACSKGFHSVVQELITTYKDKVSFKIFHLFVIYSFGSCGNLSELWLLLLLTETVGKRSLLWISQHWKPKRTSKNLQTITTSKVTFLFITTTTIRTSKMAFELITTTTKIRLSMFWFYLWRQKRSQRQKSKYQLPMAYYLW